jgi:hypothetical protein
MKPFTIPLSLIPHNQLWGRSIEISKFSPNRKAIYLTSPPLRSLFTQRITSMGSR